MRESGVFIIHEKTFRWTAVVRKYAPDLTPIRTKSLRILSERVARHRASFLLIEIPLEQAKNALPAVNRLKVRYPHFRFAVVSPDFATSSPDEADDWIFTLREFGALHVLVATREIRDFIPSIRKHFREIREPHSTFRETIALRYPWKPCDREK